MVQRARPPPPDHRHRHQRPARSRRALDHARPLARPGGQAGQAPGRPGARGPQPRLLLRQRLDRTRDRAQDGLPIHQQRGESRRTGFICLRRQPTTATRSALGLGRRHRALPRDSTGPLLFDTLAGAARRRRRTARAPGRARRSRARRSSSSRSCRARRESIVHPEGYLRAVRELCDEHGALAHLRRGRHRLRAHGHDVRLRAGGRRARPHVRGQGPHGRLPARWPPP